VRKLSKYSAVLLTLFTGFAFMGTASAVNTGPVQVTCTNGTFGIGWDNDNRYFEGKGNIAAFYCQVVHNTGYVSDNITDPQLRWYQGVVIQDSPTAIDETQTVVVVDSPTSVVVDSPTVDTSDVPLPVSDSDTAVDTATVSDTPTVIVDTLTTETETPQVIEETQTVELPVSQPEPLPTPSPVVIQPEPVRPIESQVPEIQPEPQPEPEPEPSEPESDDELDLLDPEEELPVDEPILPDEELSEYPEEEETNEIPSDPEILEPIELTPEPLPQPIVEPELTSPPDIAPVTPVDSKPMVTLDNGVVLTEEEAAAVVLLSNPAELLTELFTDPAAALAALGSVGSDMTEEEREESEKVVVSAIIAGGIATQSAAAAAGAAAYRRKP
jgi:hypothetical protein